jgi:hypothetical protein
MRIDSTHEACGQSLRADLARHLRVHLERFFQPLGGVAEAAADLDAFRHLVVVVVGGAEVGEHFFGVVEIGDGGRRMRFAGPKDAFGRHCQVGAPAMVA